MKADVAALSWLMRIFLIVCFFETSLNAADRYELRDAPFFLFVRTGPSYSHISPGGPVAEAFGRRYSWDKDKEGNLFAATVEGQVVIVITPDKRFYQLAGTGVRGYRDGPADRAMFAMGSGGYPFAQIAVHDKGHVYVTDGYNKRIRKISKKQDGTWWVETFAGGATGRIGDPLCMTFDSLGNLWFYAGALYKAGPSGSMTRYETANDRGIKGLRFNSMVADRQGNLYAMGREAWASHIWKISQDGSVEWLSGITDQEASAKRRTGEGVVVDGDAKQGSIHTAGRLLIDPDGSTLYFSGGDETGLRRYKDGRLSTLKKDGTWGELQQRNSGIMIGSVLWIEQDGSIYTQKPSFYSPDQDQWSTIRVLVPVKGKGE